MNPLKAECEYIRHYGDATLFYQTKNAGIEFDTKDIYVDTPWKKGPACVFGSAGSSLFLRTRIISGKVVFDSSTVPLQVHVGHPGRSQDEAVLDMQYNGASSPTLIVQYSGRVRSSVGLAATGSVYEIYGGDWVQEQGVFDELHLHGGRVIYNSVDQSIRIFMDGGIFDTSQTSRARTLQTFIQYGGEFIRSSQTTVTTYKDFRLQRRRK